MLAGKDVLEARAPVMVLTVDVGHSIGVVQDPGVTQKVKEDRDNHDQGTRQGVNHQGKSVLPPPRGLCDDQCCSVARTHAVKCTPGHTCCVILIPACFSQYGDEASA